MRTKSWIGSLLFLFSSCSSPPKDWQFEKIETQGHLYDSNRTSLTSQSEFRSLEVHIDRGNFGQRVTLNTRSLPFTVNQNQKCVGLMESDIESFSFEAYCFKGEQRLLLPDDAANWFLAQLKQGNSVKITIGRYSCTATAHHF